MKNKCYKRIILQKRSITWFGSFINTLSYIPFSHGYISIHRPVSLVAEDIAIDAGGLGFHSRVGQIVHIVPNGSPPLQCFLGAVLPRRLRDRPRHSLVVTRLGVILRAVFS